MCDGTDAVTTARALCRARVSRRRIEAAVSEGTLVRLRRGVYARASACERVRAAAAHGGAVACLTAAEHLGLWVLSGDDSVHVWLGGHGHSYEHAGCRCVEHWDEGPTTDSFGLPSVPRVLRQILACRGVEEFFVALESAMRLGRISRAGVAWLRTVTYGEARDAIAYARGDADSGLESLFRWRTRRLGLRVRTQVMIVSVGRVDFLIGDRLIVDVDGRDNHDDPAKRHKDLLRDADAAIWGYVTLRFDYAMVVHDWETVERAILAHVALGRHLRT